MNYRCLGIAISYFKYSENSIIAKILTEDFGLQSFLIRGVYAKKSKNKIALLQPLTLIEITATKKKDGGLNYIKDISIARPIVGGNEEKLVFIFIAEVLTKTLSGDKKDIPLFNFIWETVEEIGKKGVISKNYSILFLLKLSYFLGFYPNLRIENPMAFDMDSGDFLKHKTNSKHVIEGVELRYLVDLLEGRDPKIPSDNKSNLLDSLLNYYKLQHHEIKKLNSYEVIKSLYN